MQILACSEVIVSNLKRQKQKLRRLFKINLSLCLTIIYLSFNITKVEKCNNNRINQKKNNTKIIGVVVAVSKCIA